MKVALYYPWIYLRSGVERTILETVKRSKHEFTIFTNHFDRENTFVEFKKLKVIELNKVSVERGLLSVLRSALTIMLQKINLAGFDRLLVHSDGLADMILLRNYSLPVICFCHTPLRPVFDDVYRKRALISRSYVARFFFHLFSTLFKSMDRWLWKRYALVLFNSLETFGRAKSGGLIDKGEDRHLIIHPGTDWKKDKPSWKSEKYFLVPGRIMWTKNIELAIEAFKKFKSGQAGGRFKLVIAGQVDKKSRKYLTWLKTLVLSGTNIQWVINPTDSVLRRYYRGCLAVMLPAFNEDWGMTAIEANAFGKPVIATNRGGYKESQVDGKTGFLIQATPKAFADKMSLIANNKPLAKQLGKNARENAKKFSWEFFIKQLDSYIDNV